MLNPNRRKCIFTSASWYLETGEDTPALLHRWLHLIPCSSISPSWFDVRIQHFCWNSFSFLPLQCRWEQNRHCNKGINKKCGSIFNDPVVHFILKQIFVPMVELLFSFFFFQNQGFTVRAMRKTFLPVQAIQGIKASCT